MKKIRRKDKSLVFFVILLFGIVMIALPFFGVSFSIIEKVSAPGAAYHYGTNEWNFNTVSKGNDVWEVGLSARCDRASDIERGYRAFAILGLPDSKILNETGTYATNYYSCTDGNANTIGTLRTLGDGLEINGAYSNNRVCGFASAMRGECNPTADFYTGILLAADDAGLSNSEKCTCTTVYHMVIVPKPIVTTTTEAPTTTTSVETTTSIEVINGTTSTTSSVVPTTIATTTPTTISTINPSTSTSVAQKQLPSGQQIIPNISFTQILGLALVVVGGAGFASTKR